MAKDLCEDCGKVYDAGPHSFRGGKMVLEMEPIITLIASEIKMQQEERIWRAVQEADIHVDKERLLKALEDAKSFWEEGYRAGTNRPRGRWLECYEDWRRQMVGDECSHCGFKHFGSSISHYRYCPACGAKMRLKGEEEDV